MTDEELEKAKVDLILLVQKLKKNDDNLTEEDKNGRYKTAYKALRKEIGELLTRIKNTMIYENKVVLKPWSKFVQGEIESLMSSTGLNTKIGEMIFHEYSTINAFDEIEKFRDEVFRPYCEERKEMIMRPEDIEKLYE